MATYKPLKVLFRETTANAEATVNKELTKRLESPAFVTYPYYVGTRVVRGAYREIYELSEAVWATENLIRMLGTRCRRLRKTTILALVEEIQSTNEIENIQSTRREVADALNAAVQNSDAVSKRFQKRAPFGYFSKVTTAEVLSFRRLLKMCVPFMTSFSGQRSLMTTGWTETSFV